MTYNPYGGGPPGYGIPPTYGFPGGSAPPGMAAPPGLAGPPPGMSAPGTAAPPGLPQPNIAQHQANRPSGLPNSFQAPPNLPNINFNAPVIRLGTSAPKPQASGAPSRRDNDTPQSNGPRSGVGNDRNIDQQRQAMRETMQALVPPSRDDVARTIFVDGITDGIGGTRGAERILGIAGKLRRLDRATDASGKELTFGFAQFEDIESLHVVSEIFQDISVPVRKQTPSDKPGEDDETFEDFEKQAMTFRLDEASIKLIESQKEERGEDSDTNGRIEAAKTTLKHAIRELFYPPVSSRADADGDIAMGDASKSGENVEVVNIPLAQDDELADIPPEMRETVAGEIQAFRDRSIQRDMERLKREEEFEAAERQRNGANRSLRQASPPSSTNNIPLGPRGMANAPSGPKGQKSDVGKDHNRSVEFVNGGTTSGGRLYDREDEDDPASDDELERRRLAKKAAETDKMYADAERRWLNREKSRTAALEREKERDAADEESFAKNQQKMLEQLKELNEDDEETRKRWEYFQDRSAYIRNRAAFRAREVAADEADRQAEEQETARDEAQQEQARGMADSFLERQAQEMEPQRRPESTGISAPQPFKLSLGAAAQKAQSQRAPVRKTMAEVEGLLEDEEEDTSSKRQLVPIKFEPMAAAAMTDEERDQAVRSLAQEIPNETAGLWGWDVQWDYLDESVIREKLRPFIEKKLVEYLGVQEELLIEVVEEHLRKHSKPSELVEELAEALDDEAEPLVKKLWRMVIFFTESEKRGLA
ncbi:RNA-binding protein 25 [Microdochium nivale]|nr:RNA-binding protein 25 [Microdochium nivale]